METAQAFRQNSTTQCQFTEEVDWIKFHWLQSHQCIANKFPKLREENGRIPVLGTWRVNNSPRDLRIGGLDGRSEVVVGARRAWRALS